MTAHVAPKAAREKDWHTQVRSNTQQNARTVRRYISIPICCGTSKGTSAVQPGGLGTTGARKEFQTNSLGATGLENSLATSCLGTTGARKGSELKGLGTTELEITSWTSPRPAEDFPKHDKDAP